MQSFFRLTRFDASVINFAVNDYFGDDANGDDHFGDEADGDDDTNVNDQFVDDADVDDHFGDDRFNDDTNVNDYFGDDADGARWCKKQKIAQLGGRGGQRRADGPP